MREVADMQPMKFSFGYSSSKITDGIILLTTFTLLSPIPSSCLPLHFSGVRAGIDDVSRSRGYVFVPPLATVRARPPLPSSDLSPFKGMAWAYDEESNEQHPENKNEPKQKSTKNDDVLGLEDLKVMKILMDEGKKKRSG